MPYYVKDMKTLDVREYDTIEEAKKVAKWLSVNTGHTVKGFKRKSSNGVLTDYAFIYEPKTTIPFPDRQIKERGV